MARRPINPQTKATAVTSNAFTALKGTGEFAITSTVAAFYLITAAGTAAEVDGSKCHYLPANVRVELCGQTGDIVTIIAASTAGNAYLSELV